MALVYDENGNLVDDGTGDVQFTPAAQPATKLSYYGYEKKGEPDYDPNSAKAVGDRDNPLTEGKSVALSKSDRLARFGVTGKSTGLPVNVNGQTFYDQDTSPQNFKNVDVYSPSGPGNATAPNQYGLAPGFGSSVSAWQQAVKDQLGLDVAITEGYRSPDRSNQLKSQGVMALSGGKSYHNFGQAIDYGFRNPDGSIDLHNEKAYTQAGELAKRYGITPISNESGHLQNANFSIGGATPYTPGRGDFPVWGHENDQPKSPSNQYPYDPNKDPLSGSEAFTPPASPPPSWNDLTASQEWQGLSPEDKGKVTDQWYSQSFNYAGSLGNFQSDDRQKLYDFYQDARKQATYVPPLDVGKAAGDTVNEVGRKVQLNTVTADQGALEQKQKYLTEQTSGLNQQIANIKMDATLTDAQKQSSIQTLQDQFNKLKNDYLPQWISDKDKQAKELESKEDKSFTKTPLGQTADVGAKILTGAAQTIAGAPLGPAGMALTTGMGQGAESYEESRREIGSWVDEHMPKLSPEEKAAKVNDAAQQIANMNTGMGYLLGVTGVKLPIKELMPRLLAGTALYGGIGAVAGGGSQYGQNVIERQTISPQMTGEWTGVPQAAATGAAVGALGHLGSEAVGGILGRGQEPGAINEARTTEQMPAAVETPKTAENVPTGQPEPPRATVVEQMPATSTQPDVTTPTRQPGEAILSQAITDREAAPGTVPREEVPAATTPSTTGDERWVSNMANRSAQEIAPGEETRANTGTPIDLSTPDGLREAWTRDVGTPPPAGAEPVLRRTASKVRDAVDAENGSMDRLGQRIDEVKTNMSAEDVRNNIMTRMGEIPCVTL